MFEIGTKIIVKDEKNFYYGIEAVITQVYVFPEDVVYAVQIEGNISFVINANSVSKI